LRKQAGNGCRRDCGDAGLLAGWVLDTLQTGLGEVVRQCAQEQCKQAGVERAWAVQPAVAGLASLFVTHKPPGNEWYRKAAQAILEAGNSAYIKGLSCSPNVQVQRPGACASSRRAGASPLEARTAVLASAPDAALVAALRILHSPGNVVHRRPRLWRCRHIHNVARAVNVCVPGEGLGLAA